MASKKPVEPAASPQATTKQLEEITILASTQLTLEDRIAKGELLLADLTRQHKAVAEESLPNAMRAINMKRFTLTTGEEISIKDDVHASISEATREKAFQWLEDHGYQDIIKVSVSVQFDRGDVEKALKLAEELRIKKKLDVDVKQTVHSSTLKAFVKDQLEKLKNKEIKPKDRIPLETFNAMPVSVSKIKRPKV